MSKDNTKAPLWHMGVTAYSDNTITVTGFSKDFRRAMQQINSARDAILGAFLEAAKHNRLSDNNIMDESNLVIPKKGLLVPFGKEKP